MEKSNISLQKKESKYFILQLVLIAGSQSLLNNIHFSSGIKQHLVK